MRSLRLALAVEAAAVLLPIVIAAVFAAVQIRDKAVGACVGDPCARVSWALLLGSAFMFGPPAWWTISGARRAGVLTSRQLAWLLAVDVYLVVVGLWLLLWARATANNQQALSEVLTIVTAFALLATALVSAGACGARILDVSRPARSSP